MKKVLKKFGKYLLLDRLAQGGMADIFRAWASSVDGGGRLIVLKCVQPEYGNDSEFIQMFRSEIRVTMGLSHPNIVQLYDFGESEGQPYIAMELVDGKNLKQFTTRLQQKNRLLAPECAAFIISQAAAGLHFAHTYRDRTTGASLNIIHRDVSPQNLLISYEGNVKIIDFGVAKAASNRQATRAGIIKGKPSYLSPEQIDGIELDGRSDIFSLGAVLWEALTGRKLFAGVTDLEAIRMIEECDKTVKPPSKINQAVPPELDAIVFKALAKDRNQRFKTAEEMQRALHRFVYQFRPDFDPSEFAKDFQALFRSEIEEEQRAVRELNAEAKDLFRQVETATANQSKAPPKESEAGQKGSQSFSVLTLESVPLDLQSNPNIKRGNDSGKWRRKQTLDQAQLSSLSKKPPPAGSGRSGAGKLLVPLILLGAAGYLLFPTIQERRAQTHASSHARAAASLVQLDLVPFGGGARIYVDSVPVDPTHLEIRAGATSKLLIMKEGFRNFEQTITASQDASPINVHAVLEPVSYGSLTLYTTPTADVRITSGELTWSQKTPVERLKLPPGQYQVMLSNSLLGMQKQITLQIEAGKAVTQELNLDLH